MSNLTFLSKSDLTDIGLSPVDLKSFIDARMRLGAIDSSASAARLAKSLTPKGAKAFENHVKAQSMEAIAAPPGNGLNRFLLRLSPTPPMLSQAGVTLTIRFRRQVDAEDHEIKHPFSLSGAEDLDVIHDISFDHLIYYKVETAAGELVAERVLTPIREQRGELRADLWIATPPLGTSERLDANGTALMASLRIDTLRPAAAAGQPAPSAPIFSRNGRFEVIGKPDFGFGGYALAVALATPDLLTRIAGTLDTSAGKVAAQVRFAQGDGRFADFAGALPLVASELDFGGNFRLRQEGIDLTKVVGWLWVLSGSDLIAGFRPDPAPAAPAPDALIFLPGDIALQSSHGLPQDVSEAALLAQPERFSDDPGTTCKPFNTPGRILGEKRFRTVLRVTQPQVALAGPKPIRFEDQDKRTVDFPRLGVDPENPIDYEADPSRFQAQSVALGHIIEHVVRYRSNGYSLGDVAHSLTLAPREKRRVMKVDFARSERASRQEATSADDAVMDSLESEHDYENAVSGELSEWSRGSSQASAVGAAGGVGGVLPVPVVIGGGISGGSSQSIATQSSHRDTAARETQRLRDAIRRYGQSLRNLESTVVTEVSQTETVTGVSEVVQNINYTRALSVVYYEILRHLRVDTEIGAVSECVFVPMPIHLFSDERISRHRKVLARFARGWVEKSVFRYLDEIQADFTGSEIPVGEQRDQPLTRLTGSLTMTMGINMPVGGASTGASSGGDSESALRQAANSYEAAWQPFADLLPMTVVEVSRRFASVQSSLTETEKLFRTQIAPAMARAFLERLTLRGIRQVLMIDFTPVKPFKRGQPFQVDFDVALGGSLTRRQLENLTLQIDPKLHLPPGSWLNLTSASIRYATEHYEGRANQRGGTRDLIDTHTGTPDDSGALISFPPSADDTLNLQDRLRKGYAELKKTLEANTFRYHKAIWRGMDADELYALLDGYAISDTDGRSLASMIERRPLGILGNSLVFATRTDWPLDPLHKSFADLKARYVSGLPPVDPIRVSLPTSGLYARAHMDDCIAAEEHNGSFDWVFNSTEPELADFPAGMFESRRSEPRDLTPTAMPDTIISLQNAPAAPAPTGLGSTLTALGTDAFRDITGLAGTQGNLQAAMANATSLATSAMTQAVAAQAAQLTSDARAGKDITTFAAATKKAVDRGQISPEAGRKAVEDLVARKSRGVQNSGDLSDQAVQALVASASEAGEFKFASVTPSGGRVELAANKASAKKESEGSEILKTILALSEKAAATSQSALSTWISEPNEPFANVLQDALIEEAKKELKAAGANLVKEKIPIGGALMVCVKLSMEFAKGAGEELIRTNERLRRTYDQKLHLIMQSDEMTDESIDALRKLSTNQLNAVGELNRILRAGLEAVFSKAFDDLTDGIGKIFRDNEKMIINQLAKENELLAVLNGGVGAALESPRTAILGFFVKAFVAQLPKSRMQNELKTVMGNVRGTTNVPSELFAGLCLTLLDAETGALKAALGANVPDVKKLLLEEAKKLMDVGGILPVKASTSGVVEILPTEVLIPQSLISQINALSGTLDKATLEMKSAVDAFIAYKETQEQLLKYRVGKQLMNVRRGSPRSQAASSVEFDNIQTRDDIARAFDKLEKIIVRLANKAGDTRLDDKGFRRGFIRDILEGLFMFNGWVWDFTNGLEPFERQENILHFVGRNSSIDL